MFQQGFGQTSWTGGFQQNMFQPASFNQQFPSFGQQSQFFGFNQPQNNFQQQSTSTWNNQQNFNGWNSVQNSVQGSQQYAYNPVKDYSDNSILQHICCMREYSNIQPIELRVLDYQQVGNPYQYKANLPTLGYNSWGQSFPTSQWGQQGNNLWGQQGNNQWGQTGNNQWGQQWNNQWGQQRMTSWGQTGLFGKDNGLFGNQQNNQFNTWNANQQGGLFSNGQQNNISQNQVGQFGMLHNQQNNNWQNNQSATLGQNNFFNSSPNRPLNQPQMQQNNWTPQNNLQQNSLFSNQSLFNTQQQFNSQAQPLNNNQMWPVQQQQSSLSTSLFQNQQPQSAINPSLFNTVQTTQSNLFRPGSSSLFNQTPQQGLFNLQRPPQTSLMFNQQGSLFGQQQTNLFSQQPIQQQTQQQSNSLTPVLKPRNSPASLVETYGNSGQSSTRESPRRWRQEIDRLCLTPSKSQKEKAANPPKRSNSYTASRKDSVASSRTDSELYVSPNNRKSVLPVSASQTITLIVKVINPIEKVFEMSIKQNALVSELKMRIATKLTNINIKDLELSFRGIKLQNNEVLGNIGIDSMDTIQASSGKSHSLELAPSYLIPKIDIGYYVEPNLVQLARMTTSELMQVQNFTIGNQHGKIVFKGKTDVSGLDIGEIVSITNGSVQLYKSEPKPEPGQQLNKQAVIHLYNCSPCDDETEEVYIARLQQYCEESNCKFIQWKSKTWIFEVDHF